MKSIKENIFKYFLGIVIIGIGLVFGQGYGNEVIIPAVSDSVVPPNGMYRVMKVVDGDTIKVSETGTVSDIETVRLIGINTPETVDPRKEVECFGHEASDKTKELLENKNVFLLADDTQSNRDKYGRLLRYVVLEGQINVNQYLIQEGYAYEYTYRIPYELQSSFKNAEKYAKEKQKGLWKDGCVVE